MKSGIMKNHLKFTIVILYLMLSLSAKAQHYANDFENQYTWYPPWTNISILNDSIAPDNRYVCQCDPSREFGLGFSYTMPDSLFGKNLHIDFHADYRFPDTLASGEIVISIKGRDNYSLWQSHNLADYANDSATWFPVHIELNIPADHLMGHTVNAYLWNNQQNTILIDNATLDVTPWQQPSYLPRIDIPKEMPADDDLALRLPNDTLPLTYPIGLLDEYIINNDTIVEYNQFKQLSDNEYLAVSSIDTTRLRLSIFNFQFSTSFTRPCHLLRQSLVIPFIDSTLTVYRRNMATDTMRFQSEYYLDREGFQVGNGERTVTVYHPNGISSVQLDAEHRIGYFNFDYWRDHPMIHYPLSDTLVDVFHDVSYRKVIAGQREEYSLDFHIGSLVRDIPRIMPVPDGYASGIIFTEHADWTDIRTHRAILFGSERITQASDATGGFVYYGIPVTKSVFYNNPDRITNAEVSQGRFPGLQATIKTDKEFKKLLQQLDALGFDICLHSPEQYTTTPSNLKKALRYMRKHFHSTTWIDHGYNNGPSKNREDLVCDGLNPNSDVYAAKLWQRYGITYLWNAYYEENRMEDWHFDNNLLQPYPGFGDALPNRQLSTLNSKLSTFYTWCTPSTFEASTDDDWDYYLKESRLLKVVDQHTVAITHIYPAWVRPGRTFWTYDADSTIVALPGMNRALARIAKLRDEHLMLPMTVRTYFDHVRALLKVNYTVIDNNHIQLHNTGDAIKGFTLRCNSPIQFDDNRPYESRESNGYIYIWFDLKPNDKLIINLEFD